MGRYELIELRLKAFAYFGNGRLVRHANLPFVSFA